MAAKVLTHIEIIPENTLNEVDYYSPACSVPRKNKFTIHYTIDNSMNSNQRLTIEIQTDVGGGWTVLPTEQTLVTATGAYTIGLKDVDALNFRMHLNPDYDGTWLTISAYYTVHGVN